MQDIERLLSPLGSGSYEADDGTSPVGSDLRATPDGKAQINDVEAAFRGAIKAQKALDELEAFSTRDTGDSAPPAPPPPDWQRVVQLGEPILADQSKDLHVASWLLEAWCALDGIPGLTQGFLLIDGLCQQFWPHLFPLSDPDDLRENLLTCLRPLYTQQDRLLKHLNTRVMVTPNGITPAVYDQAVTLERLDEDKRARRIRNGAKTLQEVREDARTGRADFFRNSHQELTACAAAADQCHQRLQQLCQTLADAEISSPAFGDVVERLQQIARIIEALAPAGAIGTPSQPEESTGMEAAPTTPSATGTASTNAAVSLARGPLQSRGAAFEQLREIAFYFRTTEPHSPISYALEQAVRWGSMSLPELLTELIEEEGSRVALFRRAGIPELQPEAREE